MTWKRMMLPLLLLSLLLASCATQPQYARDEAMTAGYAAEAPAAAGAESDMAYAPRLVSDSAATGQGVPPSQVEGQERLIIRTAELNLIVRDTEETMVAIAQTVEANGGWVVNSNVYKSGENAKTGSITVRVPAAGFNSALEAFKGMAVEVTRESGSGQDVTEEYVDLSARLANLEATSARVRTFLDEADNVEEALAVNVELSRLEGEIEVIKGRMQYLSQSAAYSTITIFLTPDVLAQPITVAGWRPEGVAREAVEALITALQFFVNAAIWIVIFVLPVALIVILPLWLLARFVRRRRQKRTAVAGVG